MASLRSSFLLSAADRYSTFLISTLSVMVLSRLLTPTEVGVYSVAAAFLGFAHVFRDFGVHQYLVREENLTRDKVRASLGLSLAIAWPIGLLVFFSARPIAEFYGVAEMESCLAILAVSFFLIPFNVPALAALKRELNFRALYWVNLSNGLAHAGAAIACASFGLGALSLAWASVAGVACNTIVLLRYRPREVLLAPRFAGMRAQLSFGGWVSGGAMLQQVETSAPEIIIGRLLGVDAVGLFSRARGLVSMFDRIISNAVLAVMFPIFAKRHRESGGATESYTLAVQYLSVLAWPFFLFLGAFAEPLVYLMFGAQWLAAAPLVQVLCLGGALAACYSVAGPLLTAVGHVRPLLYARASAALCVTLLVGLGAWRSLYWASVAIAAASCLGLAVYALLVGRTLGLSTRALARHLQGSLLVTLLCLPAVSLAWMAMEAGGLEPVVALLACAAAVAGSWLLAITLVDHPIRREFKVAKRFLSERRQEG